MNSLSVRDAAQQTGVSIHTLHYYEREGLVRVDRTPSGHRRYSEGDLGWIRILTCLRDTGMPIRKMREFSALVARDADNIPERIALLEAHERSVLEHIAELHRNLEAIKGKIEHYRRTLR